MDLQEFRDLTIIIFTIAGTVVFFFLFLFTLIIGIMAVRLISAIRNAVDNGVMPALSSFRDTANNVRGSTAFIADTAVAPIIRVYSIFAGVQRAASVIAGLRRR